MKRGQAALEYLVTYGWAFLAILVVLGALAYFGFLNPGRYLPSRCDFGVQLECIDFILQDTSPEQLQLQFRNSFGDDINITAVQPLECGSGSTYSPSIRIAKGDVSSIVTMTYDPLDECLLEGERQSVVLNVTFRRDKSNSPVHGVIGEIFSTVQTS